MDHAHACGVRPADRPATSSTWAERMRPCRRAPTLSASLLLPIVLSSCLGHLGLRPPKDPTRTRQTREIVAKIEELGRDGDWLVTRGYNISDDLVAAATNTPISHVGLFDGERRSVIEAEAKGVHLSPLFAFVHKSHRVLLIRPVWSEGDAGRRALKNARKLIGRGYDFLGTVGIDDPARYYCSELVIHVYREFHRQDEDIPLIIEPGELDSWGGVLYDSGPRE